MECVYTSYFNCAQQKYDVVSCIYDILHRDELEPELDGRCSVELRTFNSRAHRAHRAHRTLCLYAAMMVGGRAAPPSDVNIDSLVVEVSCNSPDSEIVWYVGEGEGEGEGVAILSYQ